MNIIIVGEEFLSHPENAKHYSGSYSGGDF